MLAMVDDVAATISIYPLLFPTRYSIRSEIIIISVLTLSSAILIKKKIQDLEGETSLQFFLKKEIGSVLEIKHETSGLKPHTFYHYTIKCILFTYFDQEHHKPAWATAGLVV